MFHRHALPGRDRGEAALTVTAEHGLERTALRLLTLGPEEPWVHHCGEAEWILLPLTGSCTVSVTSGPEESDAPDPAGVDHRTAAMRESTFELAGRDSVFSAVTDFAYLPRRARCRINSSAGGRFALAGARCGRTLPARYGPASGVPVELRGRGSCSRQVNNFAAADTFSCDRLIAVEVLTPGGNWSSYPPHKHDEQRPGEESELEEIYYYEIAPHGTTEGLGYQRVTPSPQGRTDLLVEVRTGDAVLIPNGWHGPSIAAPGHDMYYLNVMAGPGANREWLIQDHPDHGWIRDTWPAQPLDSRLPFYRSGRTEGEGS
ncbi:5-deoxy-glucuronate isomerase [Streptomyces sp. NPDC006879]|uniref:5-deoxy-glucuronate isomerase n=1 Tax=Streptomyces sp. NPDC006879 TaxID=3364767 RepID=UPI00367D7FFB